MKTLKSYRFDEPTINLIDDLKTRLRLENNSAVLRRSLTLLKVASDAADNGGSVIIRDSNGDREIVL